MPRHETPPTIDGENRQDVLDALADPACRSILDAVADRPLTASEVTEVTDVPLSTVYRKLDQLIDTPLVEERHRLDFDGKHARQYQCVFERIRIQLADANDRTLVVSVS